MDIGTKDNPGRELNGADVADVNGGAMLPDGPPPTRDDPFGEPGGRPIDYFDGVAGGDSCPDPEPEPIDPSDPEGIRRILEINLGSGV